MLEDVFCRRMLSTAEMQAIWYERASLALWLGVEQVIAAAQAELGLIPAVAAEALAAISVDDLDPDRLAADLTISGRPIVGLVKQLRERVGPGLAGYVHLGTATQDLMDTALALQMRDSLSAIECALARLRPELDRLVLTHGDAVLVGRTNGQHALPITFGLKLETWRADLGRRRAALADAAGRGLMVQLGGPVGDLGMFDQSTGTALKRTVAARLGLRAPHVPWQNARDGVAEIVGAVGVLCASLCRIAHNVNALSGSDIGELHEAPGAGIGASSSMVHKRNQRASEFAEATARLARQSAERIGETTLQEHERSGGVWIAEWMIVPETFLLASGALLWAERMLCALEVDRARMAAALQRHSRATARAASLRS